MKKYEEVCGEYEGICGKYEENVKKVDNILTFCDEATKCKPAQTSNF